MEADDPKHAKAVVLIPFEEQPDDDEDYIRLLTQDHEMFWELRLRLDAYRRAWLKCLQRLQSSIRSRHEQMVEDIVQHVKNACSENTTPTPYKELPVVCIQSSLSGSSISDDISASLAHDGDPSVPHILQIHVYASDCPNVVGGMKAIITKIIEQSEALATVKRKPSTSLANFDIEMLMAWYTAHCNVSENSLDPLLAIIMHDFEQFNPSPVQDIFYIFSQHVSRLRSVFIISLSSPVTPSFLHVAYPKSTLALLSIETFVAPSGYSTLERALQHTYFDVDFDPDILLGPKTLEQIICHVKRNNISQDLFLTSIQLVHLRHFLLNPLSLLAQETPSIMSDDDRLCDMLKRRLEITEQKSGRMSPTKKRAPKTMSHIASLDQARTNFACFSRKLRLGFSLVLLVYDFIRSQELEDLKVPQIDLTDMMLETLRGKTHNYIHRLAPIVRSLDEGQLTSLLDRLHEYFERPDEKKAREEIANFLSLLVDKARPEQVARDLCDWLEDYAEGSTKRYDDLSLWDIWCTGDAPFPSEFLNPSNRATILSGLLRPHDFVMDPSSPAQNDKIPEIWELPDTSILFKRYMESGRMINVYDWFESFQVALEGQREHLKKLEPVNVSHSPGKRGKKEKALQRPAEESEEKWKLEVQARFMRALHELDYLGFIKHTGRKADHVLRTVFDVGD